MSQIKTYTGIMIDPVKPFEEGIKIEDIAHALSMLCRANGHFHSFHSVGQHCINCMNEAKARGLSKLVQLACLLHDGSEAYLSDVTRPVKEELPKYKEIETPLQNMIWGKWLERPLTDEEYKQVFEIDDAVLHHEFLNLMDGTVIYPVEPKLYSKPEFAFKGFKETEQEYLDCLKELTR